jgi:hypothetical protein
MRAATMMMLLLVGAVSVAAEPTECAAGMGEACEDQVSYLQRKMQVDVRSTNESTDADLMQAHPTRTRHARSRAPKKLTQLEEVGVKALETLGYKREEENEEDTAGPSKSMLPAGSSSQRRRGSCRVCANRRRQFTSGRRGGCQGQDDCQGSSSGRCACVCEHLGAWNPEAGNDADRERMESELSVTLSDDPGLWSSNAWARFTGQSLDLTEFRVVERNAMNTFMQMVVAVDSPYFEYDCDRYREWVLGMSLTYHIAGYISANRRVARVQDEFVLLEVISVSDSHLEYSYKSRQKGVFEVRVEVRT